MSMYDLYSKEWEIVNKPNCDYCHKGQLLVMLLKDLDCTLLDFDESEQQEIIEKGHYEAVCYCPKCHGHTTRWVKEVQA